MSGNVVNLNKFLAEKIESVFGKDAGEVKPNDARVKVLSNYLDGFIRVGVEDENGNVFKPSAVEVKNEIDKITQGNKHLQLALQEVTTQLKDTWLSGAEQKLPEMLLKHSNALGAVCTELDKVADGLETRNSHEKEGRLTPEQQVEVRNIFFNRLQVIASQIINLSGDDKTNVFQDGVAKAAKEIGAEYGAVALRDLSSSVKDSSAVSYTYGISANTGLEPMLTKEEIIALANNILEFKRGNFDSLGDPKAVQESKAKVLNLITEIAENGGKFAGDLKLEVKVANLSKEEKAYYEFLRQGAQEIKDSTNNPLDLLKTLTNNLPEMLMPAIIGAVIGYLMGGMEVVGGIGAVAMSFLGSSTDSFTDDTKKTKLLPPQFTLTT